MGFGRNSPQELAFHQATERPASPVAAGNTDVVRLSAPMAAVKVQAAGRLESAKAAVCQACFIGHLQTGRRKLM